MADSRDFDGTPGSLQTVIKFLAERGYSQECIEKIRKDRIDVSAVQSMDDRELSKYVEAFGDRVNLRSLCKPDNGGKKSALFDRLRKKMKLHEEDVDLEKRPSRSLNLLGNKNAQKMKRKIELGWIHNGKHIRSSNGGGSRKIELVRDAKKADILKEAKTIFFPEGISKKGVLLSSVTCKVLDFAQTEFSDEISISEMYDTVKMGMLRFHLCTKTEENIPSPSFLMSENSDDLPDLPDPECVENSATDIFFNANEEIFNNFSEPVRKNENMLQDTLGPSQIVLMPQHTTSQIQMMPQGTSPPPQIQVMPQDTSPPPQISMMPGDTSLPQQIRMMPRNTSLLPQIQIMPQDTSPQLQIGMMPRDSSPPPQIRMMPRDSSPPPQIRMLPRNSSPPPQIQMMPRDTSPPPQIRMMPRDTSPPPQIPLITVRVHRVKILEDLINTFNDPDIIKKPVKFAFINESGADQSGVSRDVYTSFWMEFFSRAAEGEDNRVPALNPHWKAEEWKSIGRILVKGLMDHNIFPLNFAPAFISALLFGEHSVSEETLMSSFLLYLNQSDRDLAKVALTRQLSEEENEDFLDMLDRFGCKKIPKIEEMKKEFLNIAHKEIIQKPKYALEKMVEVCRKELIGQITTEADLLAMYEAKRPTVRKILKMITSNPMTPAENQCIQFLKQYIKSQNQNSVEKLLRFLTGTDVCCVEKINVTFTKLVGLGRRPVAHTCGPVLELPSTYLSYIELRHEFDNILQNSGDHCMEMNIA